MGRGKKAVKNCVLYLFEKNNQIGSCLRNNVPIEINHKIKFKSATHCEMCDREVKLLFSKVPNHVLNG